MAYTKKLHEKAFTLFSNDITMEDIARQMKISTDTLWRWHREEEWATRKQSINQKAIEKTDESLVDIKVRQRKIIKAIYGKYLEALKKGEIDPKTHDIAAMMKQELLLAGESTENIKVEDLRLQDVARMFKKYEKKGA